MLSRFLKQPLLFGELLAASLFIALLNLALPLFAIQLFNRYLGHGYNGTLYTLTGGVLIALALVHIFRLVRARLLTEMTGADDLLLGREAMELVVRVKNRVLEALPPAAVQGTLSGVRRVTALHDPGIAAALFDFPFSLLYVVAIFLLHPALGWIAAGFIGLGLAAGLWQARRATSLQAALYILEQEEQRYALTAVTRGRALRLFNGRKWLLTGWSEAAGRLAAAQETAASSRERNQGAQMSLAMLLYVMLYAVGAVIVVKGGLSVGALIGANILAARAFQNVGRFVHFITLKLQADRAIKALTDFHALPLEMTDGIMLPAFSGRVRIENISFTYPGAATPVFEGLDCEINPGELLLVCGKNGAGKSTLARLLAGLLEPDRGEISAEGVTLRQLQPQWWRQQLLFLPQEPEILDATILENIIMTRPDANQETIDQAVRRAGLCPFLDRRPRGIRTRADGRLPAGIAKRVALARALVTDGPLAVLDEPFEGIDPEGRQTMIRVVRDLLTGGKGVVLLVHDPKAIGGAGRILDLDARPRPRLIPGSGPTAPALAEARP